VGSAQSRAASHGETRVKKIRRKLGIAAATAGLSLASTMAAAPAHADPYYGYTNLNVVAAG
jgi:hypothetical protein